MGKLQQHQVAPDFQATTTTGDRFTLRGLRGRKIVLSFMRHAKCAFCNYRLHELSMRRGLFESAGVEVYGVLNSTPDETRAHTKGNLDQAIKLIANPSRSFYRNYGVVENVGGAASINVFITDVKALLAGYPPTLRSFLDTTIPADFLIDPEGVLWLAHYGNDFTDHVSFDVLEEFVADPCLTVAPA